MVIWTETEYRRYVLLPVNVYPHCIEHRKSPNRTEALHDAAWKRTTDTFDSHVKSASLVYTCFDLSSGQGVGNKLDLIVPVPKQTSLLAPMLQVTINCTVSHSQHSVIFTPQNRRVSALHRQAIQRVCTQLLVEAPPLEPENAQPINEKRLIHMSLGREPQAIFRSRQKHRLNHRATNSGQTVQTGE